MSFCLSKWAVIYAGSMRPFVWAIIPHVIIIILRRSLIVAISLARRSHPAGRGPLRKGCCRHFRLGVSVSSQAEEGSFAPLKGTARREDASGRRRCLPETPKLFITCLLPVYSGSSGAEQLFKVVLQSTAEWAELGSSQRRQHITIRLLPWQRRA